MALSEKHVAALEQREAAEQRNEEKKKRKFEREQKKSEQASESINVEKLATVEENFKFSQNWHQFQNDENRTHFFFFV